MPLRVRLIALVGLVLLLCLGGGSALVGWHAASSVRTELRAALDVGANTIHNGFDDLAGSDDRAKELRHLVATFNGNRHVRATLLDAEGRPAATSRLLAPSQRVPDWVLRLIADAPTAVRLPVPAVFDGGGAIVLQADPTNEIGEVWTQSRDAVLVLAGFAVLSALLMSAVLGRALRSLEDLSAAFDHIGKGDYHGSLPAQGAPELTRLANGFNVMSERLATAAAQNHRLNERLLTLQAEERADLARDLHDEIGPMLFAIDMTAAAIERLAGSERETEIPRHVQAIHEFGWPDAAAYPVDPGTPAAATGDWAERCDRSTGNLLAQPPPRHRIRRRSCNRGRQDLQRSQGDNLSRRSGSHEQCHPPRPTDTPRHCDHSRRRRCNLRRGDG